jgi:hypothetical protein
MVACMSEGSQPTIWSLPSMLGSLLLRLLGGPATSAMLADSLRPQANTGLLRKLLLSAALLIGVLTASSAAVSAAMLCVSPLAMLVAAPLLSLLARLVASRTSCCKGGDSASLQ